MAVPSIPCLVQGHLYVMGEKDTCMNRQTRYYKIGIVKNDRTSEKRRSEHQTGNPREVLLLSNIHTPTVERVETTLHQIFASHRVNGEWFHFDAKTYKNVVCPVINIIVHDMIKNEKIFELWNAMKYQESNGIVNEPTEKETTLHEQYCKILADIQHITKVMEDQKNFLIENDDPSVYSIEKTCHETVDIPQELKEKYKIVSVELSGNLHIQPITMDPSVVVNVDMTHTAYLKNLSILARKKHKILILKAKIIQCLGNNDGITGIIKWKRVRKERVHYDMKKLKIDNPEFVGEEKSRVSKNVQVSRYF